MTTELPDDVDLGPRGREWAKAKANQSASNGKATGNGKDDPLSKLVNGDDKIKEKKNAPTALIKKFKETHRLIHNSGIAYAVRRGSALFATGTPGIAQPFGAGVRRKIVNMATGAITKGIAEMVMLNLDSEAFSGPETPLGLRFYQAAPDRIYLDLGREDGKCVEIGPGEWKVVQRLPSDVVFRRSHAMGELPVPVRGGRCDELAPLLAMEPDSRAFKLLVGWQIGLLFDASVRPGVLVFGPSGCGKTTRLRLVVSVVEPSGYRALGSSFGRNAADDQVRALHRAVPLWDNLSSVSQDTSDELCRLITGMSREGRALYSNSELSSDPIRRPVGLTAVSVPAGLRPDALQRLIPVEVAPIAARIEDAEVQARFDAAHPRLLGAVLDAVAMALLWRSQVAAPTQYRMAAYAQVLAAIDVATNAGALPGCPTGLLDAYATTLREARQRTAAEDAFGEPLLALLKASQRQAAAAIGRKAIEEGLAWGYDLTALERGDEKDRDRAAELVAMAPGWWKGKASELLDALEGPQAGLFGYRTVIDRKAPGWPSTPRRVPEVLAHLQDGLAELGVTWTTTLAKGHTRYSFTLRGEAAPE